MDKILIAKPKLIIVGGVSGAGKTTTAKILAEYYENAKHYKKQYTTRCPREDECNSDSYIFVTKEDMDRIKKSVSVDFVGNKYAYCCSFADEILNNFSRDLSVIVDSIHSIHEWKRFLLKNPEIDAISFFLCPSCIDISKNRIIKRQPDIKAEELEGRLNHWRDHIKEAEFFDHIINTDNFDIALEKIKKTIEGR